MPRVPFFLLIPFVLVAACTGVDRSAQGPKVEAAEDASTAVSDAGAFADAGPTAGACTKDDDCRTFSDYCTGCDCRALLRSEPDPKCAGQGVRCLVDPCMRKHAACVDGRCAVALGAPSAAARR